jgi:hypothetical protein
MTSARQAGSGGVALEDPWRQGELADLSTILLTSGLRWYGFGVQGGVGPQLRMGFDGFAFVPEGITETREASDGTYGGEGGQIALVEWGARMLVQRELLAAGEWRLAGLARLSTLVQRLPDEQNLGVGLEAGVQAQRGLGDGRALTGSVLAGPLGRGASRAFASEVTCGAGLLSQSRIGLLGGPEGYAAGLEGEVLSEGLVHGGLGLVYWFGRLAASGTTFFLRAGVRSAEGSAQTVQPRGGIGVLWRSAAGLGLQFDYAAVPIGELGWYHYVTLGVRLPQAAPAGHE